MSLADEENVQPLLSEQDVETGEEREAPPHAPEAEPLVPPVGPPPLPVEPEEPDPEE